MRVPLSWLRDFASFEDSPAALATALDGLGLVVDGLVEVGEGVRGVVAAEVLGVRPHPGADRLTLVDVELGGASGVEVVCGARNLAPGDRVPYAAIGACLAGGLRIERRRIRGVISEGMLCSARELGIGDDHEGILHLPAEAELGQDVSEILGLGDVVFDLDVTPNRPDALSVAGVARDLAAVLGLPFRLPEPFRLAEPVSLPGPGSFPEERLAVAGLARRTASLLVEAPDRCPRYIARVGRVRLGPSPAWLARRLTLAGMRPISNVVDVTNYVLLERGQPLHAFDLARLGGRGIVVRLAAEGERVVTLDKVSRILSAGDLLVCDAERVPQAIAGVMGAGSSEVGEGTEEILLEAAHFESAGIALTSKRLGLRTESSVRFERGVDPCGVDLASRRAWELLAEFASGDETPGVLEDHPAPFLPRRIRLRVGRVNALLGTALSAGEVRSRLSGIGVTFLEEALPEEDSAGLVALVPTFRPDLEREIDLVEEVARHHGYNRIARTLPRPTVATGGLTVRQRERRLVADALVGAGFSESWTLSLVSPADLEAAGFFSSESDEGGHRPERIEVENPLRAEESLLRPAILPGLLRSVALNGERGQGDVALFETGRVFLAPLPGEILPNEREHLAVVIGGSVGFPPHEPERPAGVFDATAALAAVARALRLADWRLVAASPPGLHPARAASVVVDGDPVGVVGEIAPEVVGALRLPGPVVAFEVDLDRLLDATRSERRYAPLSRYPAASVDLAFVLSEEVPAGVVAVTLATAVGDLCEEAGLFDVFRSEALGSGCKSLAYRLRLRAPDRTLTDGEVAALRQRGIEAVARVHHGRLRS